MTFERRHDYLHIGYTQLAIMLTLVLQFLLGLYYMGRLSRQVDDQGDQIKQIRQILDRHLEGFK